MLNQLPIFKEIEGNSDMPVLPPGVSYLLKILNNEDVTYKELAKELENFPSIAVKIVSTANSAWASPVSPITTLQESCARIGLPLVRSIAIALSVAQVFDPTKCPLFNSEIFWTRALMTAEAAFLHAKEKNDVCPSTARLAGLLHNIGMMWLANQKPEVTSKAIQLSKEDESAVSACLISTVGINLYEVSAYLIFQLELPEILYTSINALSQSFEKIDTDNELAKCLHDAKRSASRVIKLSELDTDEVIIHEDKIALQLLEKIEKYHAMAKILFYK